MRGENAGQSTVFEELRSDEGVGRCVFACDEHMAMWEDRAETWGWYLILERWPVQL